MADQILHWDQYKSSLAYSKLLELGQTKTEAIQVLAELHLTFQDVEEVLRHLSPTNVAVFTHIHVTEEMADTLGDDHAQCETCDLGTGFKALVIYALCVLHASLVEQKGH